MLEGRTFNFKSFTDMRQRLSKPEIELCTKASLLRLNGDKVNYKNLAAGLNISASTLYARYGRDLVHEVCRRPGCELWQNWKGLQDLEDTIILADLGKLAESGN
jgi:hypothetical protein